TQSTETERPVGDKPLSARIRFDRSRPGPAPESDSRARSTSNLSETSVADGVQGAPGRGRPRLHPELPIDALQVGLEGAGGDAEKLRYGPVGLASGDRRQNLGFAA